MEASDLQPLGKGPAAALGRMPTGAKVFLILLICLLPLALIALIITVQTTRSADTEARDRVRAITEESSTVVENVLANQVGQLAQALASLERDPRDAPSCTRLIGTFAAQGNARFAIIDSGGRLLCGQRFVVAGEGSAAASQVRATILDDGLAIRIGGAAGGTAVAYYPAATLMAMARPTGFVPDYGAAILRDGKRLELRRVQNRGPLARTERTTADLSVDELTLEISTPGAPINSPLIITSILLIAMLLLAAGIGWLVVDRLLIRPLRELRRGVRNYTPGEVIDVKRFGPIPAQELRELGETFREISRTVQLHESDLADGLVRQTKLTREVHHRVKNNLQVISSLINFHARAAKSAEASDAYASIQRRVDALAVVHRHHYAEMEENRGLELRSVVGELAANIRATAPESASSLGITLEIEPLLVNQDVAIAVAFLLTELIELAMSCNPATQVRISIKGMQTEENRAILRVNSPALAEGAEMEALVESRYGRVISGLARQLRTKLHYDPLVGAYEAAIAITGRP